MIRGKTRIGYDLTYEILFEKDDKDGTITISNQMDDDNEGEVEVEAEDSGVERELKERIAPALMEKVAEVM